MHTVAIVGFKNETNIMLQEGVGSVRVCAGFDTMDNVTIDGMDFSFIIVAINFTIVTPETGHSKNVIL